MGEPHVLYKVEGHFGIISFNRVDAKNSLSHEMISLTKQFLDEACADDRIRVVILTGNGKAFSAGGNIPDFAEGKLRGWDFKNFLWEELHKVVFTVEEMEKPVIAAVNGAAMGAGMDLALMCDLRTCSDRAQFAQSYINMGIIAGDGGAYFLSRLVGIGKTLELLLTADVLSAQEALSLGIVNHVFPHDRLMDETLNLAEKIASKPLLAVQMMKRSVYQARSSTLRGHLDYVSSQNALLSETEDHIEAAKAFLERRKPLFKGR